jgi:hypothetical protein
LCRREFIFQAKGVPVFEEFVESPPSLPIKVDDSALSGVTKSKFATASKTIWSGPFTLTPRLVALGAFAAVCVCIAILYYLTTKPIKDPPGFQKAKAFFESQMAQLTIKTPGLADARIEYTNVEAIKDDPRKLPWLWEGYTSMKVRVPSKINANETVEGDLIFQCLYQFNPLSGQSEILWIETGSPIYGLSRTKGTGSEWTKEFRDKVNRAWEPALAEFLELHPQQNGKWSKESMDVLSGTKESVAKKLGLSPTEFQEILEAKY